MNVIDIIFELVKLIKFSREIAICGQLCAAPSAITLPPFMDSYRHTLISFLVYRLVVMSDNFFKSMKSTMYEWCDRSDGD